MAIKVHGLDSISRIWGLLHGQSTSRMQELGKRNSKAWTEEVGTSSSAPRAGGKTGWKQAEARWRDGWERKISQCGACWRGSRDACGISSSGVELANHRSPSPLQQLPLFISSAGPPRTRLPPFPADSLLPRPWFSPGILSALTLLALESRLSLSSRPRSTGR